jgi:hypothetical protein
VDFDHRRQVSWRSDLRQYVIVEWPPQYQSNSSSGPAITIERDTTDTGERKQFFGRTARRLITRVRRSDGPASVIDGWYIEAPGIPKWKRGAVDTVLTISAGGQRPAPPRIEIKQTGPVPEGLAVWQKITSSMLLPGGSYLNPASISEITDLVEGTLPDRLFQPPADYQRVASLPSAATRPAARTWAELLRAHWHVIEEWFSTLQVAANAAANPLSSVASSILPASVTASLASAGIDPTLLVLGAAAVVLLMVVS